MEFTIRTLVVMVLAVIVLLVIVLLIIEFGSKGKGVFTVLFELFSKSAAGK